MKFSMSNVLEGLEVTVSVQLHHEGSRGGALVSRLATQGAYIEDEGLDTLQEILRTSMPEALLQADSTLRIAIEERLLSFILNRHSSRNSFSDSPEDTPAAASSSEASPKSLEQISDTARLIYERREKLNKKFTFGELLKRDWKGLTTRDQVWLALDELIDAGLLSVTAERTGGRPTKKYSWLSNEPTTKGL